IGPCRAWIRMKARTKPPRNSAAAASAAAPSRMTLPDTSAPPKRRGDKLNDCERCGTPREGCRARAEATGTRAGRLLLQRLGEAVGRTAEEGALRRHHDRPLDEDRMLGHGLDDRRIGDARRGQ